MNMLPPGPVHRVFERLTRAMAMAGLFAMLLFAAVTIADGLLRWAVDQPIDAVRDVGNLVAAVSMAACLPHALLTRGNITIRFVSAFIGGQPSRFADTAAAVCVAAVMSGMVWQFYMFAGTTARARESTPLLAIPIAPFWYAVDAVLVVALAAQLLVLGEEVRALLRRTPLAATSAHPV